MTIERSDVLILVDIQRDLCEGGTLLVPQGGEIVPIANHLGGAFENLVLTQVWHPKSHRVFASAHPGKRPYDLIDLPYGPQILWPDHCIQGTRGAEFHPDLRLFGATLILRKGFRRDTDSCSAFVENDRTTPTGLAGYLRERGLRRVFLAGLAFDFSVGHSALDAARLGFAAFVIVDACRGFDIGGSVAKMHATLRAQGVALISSTAIAS